MCGPSRASDQGWVRTSGLPFVRGALSLLSYSIGACGLRDPGGIRTHVAGVKDRHPRPLDDGIVTLPHTGKTIYPADMDQSVIVVGLIVVGLILFTRWNDRRIRYRCGARTDTNGWCSTPTGKGNRCQAHTGRKQRSATPW